LGLLNTDKAKDFSLGVDGILRFKNRICIPEDNELKQTVLSEQTQFTSRNDQDVSRSQEVLLVAWHEE